MLVIKFFCHDFYFPENYATLWLVLVLRHSLQAPGNLSFKKVMELGRPDSVQMLTSSEKRGLKNWFKILRDKQMLGYITADSPYFWWAIFVNVH